MSSKKVKIYCYKLAKPVAKSLMKSLKDKVGRIEYDKGFIKENLGNIYLITLEKMKKGDEIALSNDFKFSYGGSLNKKINYIPYSSIGTNASDGNFLVMPGKVFLEKVDPNNTYIETVILDDIVNMIFQEEKKNEKTEVEVKMEVIEEKEESESVLDEEVADTLLNEEPVVSQVTIEEQEPVMSTDPLDLAAEKPFYYADPEEFIQPLIDVEVPTEEEITTGGTYSENPEEWFVEEKGEPIYTLEELSDKIKELEQENFRLSNKINNTIEELKNITFFDVMFGKWKTKLLDILNL